MSTKTAVVILLAVLMACVTTLVAVSWASEDSPSSDPNYFCRGTVDC